MLFNGLRNFAGNDVVDAMQRLGMDIGPHINAYVSTQTVANLINPLHFNMLKANLTKFFVSVHCSCCF
jgi:short subunit fatty acids transporter